MPSDRKIRVLSVDDHAFLAEGLRARLSMEPDMEVVGHSPDASALVERVRQLAVDVVLLDVEMPGPDPFEALADLRRLCPDVRTVILSAYVRDRYIDATVKAGAWGYLAKSDAPEAIILAVRDVMRGRFTFGPHVLERVRQMGRAGLSGAGSGPPADAREAEATGSAAVAAAGVNPFAGSGGAGSALGVGAGGQGFSGPPGAGGVAGGVTPQSRLGSLTPRELQVLRMIGKGLSRTDIAKAIFRSPKTVDAHRSSIMEKLAIHDRVELVRYAIREGLVEV